MNHVSGPRAQRLNADARWNGPIAGNAPQRPMGMSSAWAMPPPQRRATRSRGLRMGVSVTGLSLLLAMSACSKYTPNEAAMQTAPVAESAAVLAAPMEAVVATAASASSVDMAKDAVASRQRAPSDGGAEAPQQRFVAVRHQMNVEAPAAKLADVWTAVRDACGRLDCEVLTSELQRETAQVPVSAKLTMRVAPKDYNALSQAMGGDARVVNYGSSSEDKTSQVIDVEAHIKNRSEYRDSLRELLREKGVKRTLSDLMEIRDTLSNVQAEIDAAQAQRKLLERDTAKQLVTMSFQPERVIASGTYSPWQQTWRRSWDSLTGNMQSMVITAAGALPWLIVLLVVGVPVWLGLRKRSQRRQARAFAGATPSAKALHQDAHDAGAETRL